MRRTGWRRSADDELAGCQGRGGRGGWGSGGDERNVLYLILREAMNNAEAFGLAAEIGE